MIRFLKGDIFASSCQTLVNPVNCEGVMGKGLAKAFKDRWPEMYKEYQAACIKGHLQTGRLHVWKGPEKWVVNFPTKKLWRLPSKMEYIEEGLSLLSTNLEIWEITSMAIPALGCGLGGLEWTDVKERIVSSLVSKSIPIEVYEP